MVCPGPAALIAQGQPAQGGLDTAGPARRDLSWLSPSRSEQLNAYLVYHYHQYICSALADLLRYFALSLAILLAIADCLDIPWRLLRFVLVSLFLLLCADVQVGTNEWPFLDAGKWAIIFAVILLLFMVGHSLVHAVLRRCFKPPRFRWWYPGFCLVFGLVPLLVLGVIDFTPATRSNCRAPWSCTVSWWCSPAP